MKKKKEDKVKELTITNKFDKGSITVTVEKGKVGIVNPYPELKIELHDFDLDGVLNEELCGQIKYRGLERYHITIF